MKFYSRVQKGRSDRLMLAKIPFEILQEGILKRKVCKIDLFSSALRLMNLANPMLDFTLKNLPKIKKEIQCDIRIFRTGNLTKPIYKALNEKYEKCLYFMVGSDELGVRPFRDFELHLEEINCLIRCRKTEKCKYTSTHLPTLRRHELTCCDVQSTVEKQDHYGDDKTVIHRLVKLGHLPSSALNFRKSFITSYDIESLEDITACEDIRNVEAVHRLCSIALSTNRGHSRCFVRSDSSHEAAVQMIDAFLCFLDEINVEHELEIPNYFHECISKLEELTSEDSSLLPRDKMELRGLMGQLKKYILHDLYGFNSGK